jgi:hypothetical protein
MQYMISPDMFNREIEHVYINGELHGYVERKESGIMAKVDLDKPGIPFLSLAGAVKYLYHFKPKVVKPNKQVHQSQTSLF